MTPNDRAVLRIVPVPERAAFSVSRAARYLGMSPNTLRKRSDAGLIPARRDETGGRVFLLRDLDAYLDGLPPYRPTRYPRSRQPAGAGRPGEGGGA
jgi:hypothetical protein